MTHDLEVCKARKESMESRVCRVQRESPSWGPPDHKAHPGHQGLATTGARVLQDHLDLQVLQVPPSQELEPTGPTSPIYLDPLVLLVHLVFLVSPLV